LTLLCICGATTCDQLTKKSCIRSYDLIQSTSQRYKLLFEDHRNDAMCQNRVEHVHHLFCVLLSYQNCRPQHNEPARYKHNVTRVTAKLSTTAELQTRRRIQKVEFGGKSGA